MKSIYNLSRKTWMKIVKYILRFWKVFTINFYSWKFPLKLYTFYLMDNQLTVVKSHRVSTLYNELYYKENSRQSI